jgi:hypothetical protein
MYNYVIDEEPPPEEGQANLRQVFSFHAHACSSQTGEYTLDLQRGLIAHSSNSSPQKHAAIIARVKQVNTWRKSASITDIVTDMRTADSLQGVNVAIFQSRKFECEDIYL